MLNFIFKKKTYQWQSYGDVNAKKKYISMGSTTHIIAFGVRHNSILLLIKKRV